MKTHRAVLGAIVLLVVLLCAGLGALFVASRSSPHVRLSDAAFEQPNFGRRGGVGVTEAPYVVAVMCLWDEALTLPLALDSTRHFVNEYVVVHKIGMDNTAEVLERCVAKWGLKVRYFVSDMPLRAARLFAVNLTQDYADVYIIQDGDEVFYSSGETAIQNSLRLLYGAGYGMVMSKMVYLKQNLVSTMKDSYTPGSSNKWGGHTANGIMLVDHPTIFLNIPGAIVINPDLGIDVPELKGSYDRVTFHRPWKFDVSIKHPLRDFLRGSFLDWSRAGSPGTIEEFAAKYNPQHLDAVRAGLSTSLEESAALRAMVLTRQLQKYSEVEWFPYPDAIRKYVDVGRLRGYEGGDIL